MSIVTLPDRPVHEPRSLALRDRVVSYFNVIYALMMHDIKNRFFGSGLGQIVLVLWPFVHIVVLLTIYVVTKRPNPYGTSLIQYSAVSLFPFICFNYVSRWIVFSAVTNRSFLQYPIIRPLDLLIARALLEIVSITLVGILLIITVFALGNDVIPASPDQAVYAVCATIFLAIGIGFLNAIIAFIIPIWNLVMVLIIILMYLSSGIIFLVSTLPEQLRYWLSFNPLLHCVEWMRSAYFTDYPTTVLDRAYVLEFSLVSLTLALILERLLRRLF